MNAHLSAPAALSPLALAARIAIASSVLFGLVPSALAQTAPAAPESTLGTVVVRDRATGLLQIHFTQLDKGKPRADLARTISARIGSYPALAGLEVQGGGDYDGDDNLDLVLRNPATGDLRVWYIQNATVVDEVRLLDPGASWVFEGVGAESPATHR